MQGRADFDAAVAIQEGLQALRDDVPFARHTEIAGRPAGNGDDAKTQRQAIAKRLSQVAALRVPPAPISRDATPANP